MQRRAFLGVAGVATATGLAGCGDGTDSGDTGPTDADGDLAHTVSVYLTDREETHDVSVTVTNGQGNSLFQREYTLSNDNESDEDALFPASTSPETVVVTVDGTRFERDWPGFEQPELPCSDATASGVELRIESDETGSPTVQLQANCHTEYLE